MIEIISEYLNTIASQNDEVPLHALIWSVDAKMRAIPTVTELNEAIRVVGPFDVVRRDSEVFLVATDISPNREVSDEDVCIAMSGYREDVANHPK